MIKDLHNSHRKHRNALYGLVIILAILQTTSFVIMSMQVSKLNVKIDAEMERTASELREFTTEIVENYDAIYQENFNQISGAITRQEEDFDQEIKLLKSAQDDFSGIIEDAVKSVVTIRTDRSIGTGFIVHSSGFIVTNYHIIIGKEENVEVVTYNRDSFQAQFIGKDELRDLALLKIPGQYDFLELADSSDLQAGKKVIAIGNPLGLTLTVTEGIISALNRVGPSGLAEYVQTDVSLNPGNSGGPLIDTQGEVVGINNFKIGGAESLGFSLESGVIKERINILANATIIA
ncbi:MAG: trypsin-like peptidase domain-containing protein [Nanoarchaeota archaeon]|nr:trypsin-like peptidase domain-containing protein [Nanoarchaeota archaeon]MBU1051700.1 trypsin-like peptidase domain-containing protein [Nanoarchaeota archaeon]MBU1987902.1 trypsin-like peptidase domain-containing protein [Nanoarchaeota archaeon]